MTLTQIDTRQCDGHGRKAVITGTSAGSRMRVFLWRVAATAAGAALFGLIAAPLLPFARLPSSLVLALSFGFAFVGGSGYGIVRAVFFPASESMVAASWTTASVSTTACVVAACAVLFPLGADVALLLSAYAIGLGIAYALGKAACIEAGCCAAAARVAGFELRRAEIAASLAIVALAAGLLGGGHAGLAAIAGVSGHLSIRTVSCAMRQVLLRRNLGFNAAAWELTLLAALLAAALFSAVR